MNLLIGCNYFNLCLFLTNNLCNALDFTLVVKEK